MKQIYHVGLTVSNLDQSIAFYRDILGLAFQGEILMEGKATEVLFQKPGCKARVAYLNGSKQLHMPPIELIQFIDDECKQEPADLFKTSISEFCFYTDDIMRVYHHLKKHHVTCLSEPQFFDFSSSNLGKSYAFYFKDIDGIILEVMQPVE